MASLSVELNSKYLVQDRPHKLYEDVIPALDMGLWPSEVTNGSFLAEFSIGTAPTTFAPLALAAERANSTIGMRPETLGPPHGRHGHIRGSTLGCSQGMLHLLWDPWLGHVGGLVSARVPAPASIGPVNHTAFEQDFKAYQALPYFLTSPYVGTWTEVAQRPDPTTFGLARIWLSPAPPRTSSRYLYVHTALRLITAHCEA